VAQNRYHRFDVWGHTLATLNGASGSTVVKLGALLHDVGKPRARQPKEGAPGEFTFHRHELVGAEMTTDICRRLKVSTEERDEVTALVANHMFFYQPEWTDGSVRRFVRNVGTERLPGLLALREADITGRGFGEDPASETRDFRARIDQLIAEDSALQIKDLAINGQDVMKLLGIPPSRRVGEVLGYLLERVLDDPGLNTREKLEDLARSAP
jgi:tRNA nucleotidyltransferase (CCA-adding enzyme)